MKIKTNKFDSVLSRSKQNNKNLDVGIAAAKSGMIQLTVLALIKGAAGLITGTVILFADAVNTLSDVISLSASYIGLSFSKKRARKGFKYGYYKAETFAAFVVAILTVYLSYQVFIRSIGRFFDVYKISYPWVAIAVSILSIIKAFQLSSQLDEASKKSNSPSLKNNAQDRLLGIFASLFVLGGIISSIYGVYFVEASVGIFMALLIFYWAIKSAKHSFLLLLDYWDDPKLIEDIRKIIKNHSKIVLEVKKIRMRKSGPVIFGEVIIEVNPFVSIKELRSALNNINREVLDLNSNIKDIVLYTIVPKSEVIKIAIPIKRNNGINSEIAPKFGSIKHYIFVDVAGEKIKKFVIKEFPFKRNQYSEMAQFFQENNTNILIVSDLHSLVYFDLNAQYPIDIYPVFQNTKDVESLVKVLMVDSA